MSFAPRRRFGRLELLGACVMATLLPVLTLIVGTRTAVQMRSCVPLAGLDAWLGLHLDVVRTVPDCPAGTFAPGGGQAYALTLVVSLALPALFAQVGVAWLLSMVALVVTDVVRLVRRLAAALLGAITLPRGYPNVRLTVMEPARSPFPRTRFLLAPALRAPPVALTS